MIRNLDAGQGPTFFDLSPLFSIVYWPLLILFVLEVLIIS